MYDLNRVSTEFKAVCENAGVQVTSPIKLNGRLTRTLGRVTLTWDSAVDGYNPSLVEFSRQLLETATDDSIRDVILHEAAHYIATSRTHKDEKHNAIFKAICAEIGTTNNTTSTKVNRTKEVEYKYTVYCKYCGKAIGGYSRAGKVVKNPELFTHKDCGFSELEVIQNW